VPSIENNAVFEAIAMICPWQKAQPNGAKLPANNVVYPMTPSIVIFLEIKQLVFLVA
jgi:hypothetical protein